MNWNELVKQQTENGQRTLTLQREVLDPEIVAHFTVEGEPVSKARARSSHRGGRHYTPETTTVAEHHVGWAFRRTRAARGRPNPNTTFGVHIGFFCSSGQRRDVDNMTKLVLDALNGLAWVDDSQVTEQSSKLQRGCDAPRTEVVIYLTAEVRTKP